MKNVKNLILSGGLFLFLIAACTNDDIKYDTSVVRNFELQLNDLPFKLNTGISTKPIFIYKDNGEYVGNYTSHFQFALNNGKYKFLATDIPDEMIKSPTNLNDLVIPQSKKADQKVNLSAANAYDSPFNEKLTMNILTRTGTLRLRATDTKADKSYSIIKTTVDVKRSGYKVADETFVKNDMSVSRVKKNTDGGINYTDDFILFQTDEEMNNVHVRIELMTQDSTVVKTKELSGNFPIVPNMVTNVDFNLNDASTPIIQKYTVTINAANWTDESFNPAAPIDVPDGYTYVSPTENLNDIYNALAADETVSEIKLFLKASQNYTMGRINITKPISILGQNASGTASKPTITMGNVAKIVGDIDYIHFENLVLIITDAYAFNFDLTTPFHIKELKYKGCNIDNLSRAFWRNDKSESKQIVDNFIIDDCTFMNFASGGRNYALINIAPENTLSNISLINSTVEILNVGFTGPIITNQRSQTGADISINIKNSTFSLLGNPAIAAFDFRADNVNSLKVNFENNLFSGVSNGAGTWMTLDNSAGEKTIRNNYRVSDFIMASWGVPTDQEPIATSSKDNLFVDYASSNLLIKDKTSAVYINNIGDPRWIK